jgi:hypothetical protein
MLELQANFGKFSSIVEPLAGAFNSGTSGGLAVVVVKLAINPNRTTADNSPVLLRRFFDRSTYCLFIT